MKKRVTMEIGDSGYFTETKFHKVRKKKQKPKKPWKYPHHLFPVIKETKQPT